jgi:hypothetical protein
LQDDHGYATSTIPRQGHFAAEFPDWLKFEQEPHRLSQMSMPDIEGFIRQLGKRMRRVALQKPISVIRHYNNNKRREWKKT